MCGMMTLTKRRKTFLEKSSSRNVPKKRRSAYTMVMEQASSTGSLAFKVVTSLLTRYMGT